jgi:hypothetical protein
MNDNILEVENQGRTSGRKARVWALGAATLVIGITALSPALRADETAPSKRAVRLSSVDGSVQISHGNQVLADTSVANTPLFEGSTVATAEDGRAEIQFEDGSVARLSPNSSLTLAKLSGVGASGEAEIDLDSGLGYFELQNAGLAGTITVKFGDSVVTGSGFTVIRINLDNPPGELAVFSGNAHLDRGSAVAVDLHGGETLALSANDASRYTLNETIEPDSWDSWNSDRDQVLSSESAAATGASSDSGQPGNPAWSDLDANGNWYNVPGQGNVWSPYDASNPGWDPYGSGNWMNSPGYGYTWVSAYSWGYLPYQCGMWNWYDSFGWGWAPGLGGCSPWWFGGAGYYGPNIGNGYGGYRPPLRPRPIRQPLRGGHLIAVDRHLPAPNVKLPARDKTSVVQIAGYTVQPMHTLSARPQYDHSASGFVNRTVVSNAGGSATGQGRAAGPTFATPGHPGTTGPARINAGGSAPHGASAAGGHNAPAAAPASHASSGGGFSAGGGGGGGGHH